jgi:hypothetical protein
MYCTILKRPNARVYCMGLSRVHSRSVAQSPSIASSARSNFIIYRVRTGRHRHSSLTQCRRRPSLTQRRCPHAVPPLSIPCATPLPLRLQSGAAPGPRSRGEGGSIRLLHQVQYVPPFIKFKMKMLEFKATKTLSVHK